MSFEENSDEVFQRHPANPILHASDWPYPVNAVFNAAATVHAGETLLLVRVEDRTGASHLTAARSADGLTGWRIDPAPALAPSGEHPEEIWGLEDPRVTWLEARGCHAVAYTGYSPAGPGVCLATTTDFRRFERLGLILCPENKDAALFPRRFDGRWRILHRPVSGESADIWISASPDLAHWGDHRVLLRARSGPFWDAGKIGLSAPPLLTPEGWLLLYHGVKDTCFGSVYRQGLALLDRDDPTRVLGRTRSWVFAPRAPYERSGDVGNVVFSCGWTLDGDEVRLYYGGADTCMAVATAPLGRLLAAVE